MGLYKAGAGCIPVCVLSLLPLGMALQRAEASTPQVFEIEAQNLSKALDEFARQSHREILFAPDSTRDRQSPGVHGTLESEVALQMLLRGSGLVFAVTPSGAIVVGTADRIATTAQPDPQGTAAAQSPGGKSARTPPDRSPLAPADENNSTGDAPALDQVTVTAEKFSESASAAPVSLSVYSGYELLSQGVFNIGDLQNIDPQVNIGQSNAGVNISVRGVATTDVTSKGDQDVAFNVDGIPLGRPREMGLALFDINRIEVLRGPQGTLYGRSATGGAINVITNRPVDSFEASGTLEFGNFNERRGQAMVNFPLADALAVRLATSFNLHDGYLDPVLGNSQTVPDSEAARDDENNRAARLSALLKITDSASLLITGSVGHVGGVGSDYNAIYNLVETRSGAAARAIYYNPEGGAVDDDFHNFNAQLQIGMDAVQLTYDGARMQYNAHDMDVASDNDPDGSGLLGGNGGNYTWRDYRGDYTTDSHELRFASSRPQPFDWVAGANDYREYIMEHDQNWATLVAPGIDSAGFNCPYYAPNLYWACSAPNPIIVGPTEHKSVGVFGQGNYHVTDDLKVTLGARYSHDSMWRHASIAAGPSPAPGQPWLSAAGIPCAPPNDCVGNTPDAGSEAASKATWRVGADYRLTERQMVYASAATGYKAGGFNDYDPVTHATSAYAPEQLTAFEVGYKGQLLRSLQLDTDFYYYDYCRMQVTESSFFGFGAAGPVIFIYTKTAPATLYGWENALRYKVTLADELDVTLAMERAYYRSLTVGTLINDQYNWSGYNLDNAPRASGTVGYEHHWFVTGGGSIRARLDSKISSGYYQSNLGGTPIYPDSYALPPTQYRQGAFTRTNISLGYGTESEKFEISAFVRNVEDKLQLTSAPQNVVPNDPNSGNVGITAPRTYGLQVTVKY